MFNLQKGRFNYFLPVRSLLGVLLIMLALTFSACASGSDRDRNHFLDYLPDSMQVGAAYLPDSITPIKAPFATVDFKRPDFPDTTVNIANNGADTSKSVTTIIQQAIDQLSATGGGTVLIPAGHWKTGRIELKSNINLHLSDQATLSFSGAVEDYQPAVFTRSEGIEVMSLGACIYANNADNIAITGKGKLIGPALNGSVRNQVMDSIVIEDFVSYKTPVKDRVYDGKNGGYIFLPMFISPINCTHVFIEGLSLENTAFWNIVPVYCDNVIIRGITVHSVGIPRGDGMDISSSKNVLVEYCTLSCGDDCFTLKAGRGEDGLRVNKPTENVVIRNCLAIKGHGGVTIGSETAAMIKNVFVQNCLFEQTNVGLRFKTRRPRGGGGDSLYYENIRMLTTGKAFQWDMLGSTVYVGDLAARLPARPVNALTPSFKHTYFKNIKIDSAEWFIKLNAIPESPLTQVQIENLQVYADNLLRAADVDSFSIKNALISTKDTAIHLLDCRNMRFDNTRFNTKARKLVMDVQGPASRNITFKNCQPGRPNGWQTNTYDTSDRPSSEK